MFGVVASRSKVSVDMPVSYKDSLGEGEGLNTLYKVVISFHAALCGIYGTCVGSFARKINGGYAVPRGGG